MKQTNKIILSAIASLSLCTSLNAGTFTFDSYVAGEASTISDGVMLTATIPNDNDLFIDKKLVTNNSSMNVTFDKAINLSSFDFNIYNGVSATELRITPNGSENSSINISQSDTFTANWTNITEFSVNGFLGGQYMLFDNIVFEIANTKTFLDAISLVNANSPMQNVARKLQDIKDNGNYSAMSSFFASLDALSSDSLVLSAIEQTTPQTVSANLGATAQITSGISGIVQQRQNANIGATGLNSGDEAFGEKNVWIKPFGSIGSQDDKNGINGFDVNTYGLGLGVDSEINENSKLGFALFYANANVDVNNVSQSSDLDVYSAIVYGNTPVIDDKTNFLYQLGYSWQKTNSSRYISISDVTANSKYTSKTASLDLKVLRDYKVSSELLLQPMISTTYRHYTNPSYSETQAGALNLDVQKFSTSELLVGIGTLVNYELDKQSKIIANVNVDYDLHDNKQIVSSSYQGATAVTFDTEGIDNGRWSYDVGVGYETNITSLSNINIKYNRQGEGSGFVNNTVSAKYTYKF